MIDYRDPRPIFEQIAEGYKKQILMGILKSDEQMPSVRTLAAELSANPNTVQKAYSALESGGYIYTVKGRGAFVCGEERLSALRDEYLNELAGKAAAVFEEAEALGCGRKEMLRRIER